MKRLMQSLWPFHFLEHHYSLVLQRCMKAKALKPCKQIHALMITNKVNINVLSLSSRLIGAYACCGDFSSSKLLFQQTPNPNAFAFNWMITTLISSGFYEEAIGYFSLFQELKSDTISPNKYTFSGILKICVCLSDLDLGKQIHSMICKFGFEMDVSVCNSLIDMYGKCGNIGNAHEVFDKMADRDVVSWTTIIGRYADMEKTEESVNLFERMRLEGVEPNDFTWNVIIAGHARIGDCDGAFKYFSRMGKEGLIPDLVTWNAMISGFVYAERAVEALVLFFDMLNARIKPNQMTITGLLSACAVIGSIDKGREIHGFLHRIGIDINVFVSSALIDMYSKCGSVKAAFHVFNTVHTKNAASWNAMIACYGKHGMVDCAIKLFERMQYEEIKTNEVTFVSVLSACSHGGLVEKGLEIFRSMDSRGIKANKEHFACVLDLLCRYGRIEEAYDVFKEIGIEATDSTIGALLNGCKNYGRDDLAEKISEDLKMEMKNSGSFVTLSNIYASEGRWGGVEDVRKVMKDKMVQKKPGSSSI